MTTKQANKIMNEVKDDHPVNAHTYNVIDLQKYINDNFEKTREESIKEIYKNKNAIDKINDDIEKLMYARNALLRDNITLTSKLVGCNHFFSIPYEKLETEFYDKHFESKDVQNVVAQVRLLFFDDTKEIYQKYNCVDIKLNDYDGDKMKFVFSNGDREFSIVIPKYVSHDDNAIQKTELCGGFMYISFSRSDSLIDATYGTLYISELKDTIHDFITAEDVAVFKTEKKPCNSSESSLFARIDNILRRSTLRNTTFNFGYSDDGTYYHTTTYNV